MKEKIIPKFVLTGGPCSGKTTSLAYLVEKLSEYGFTVFLVPETSTLITSCGIDRRRMKDPLQIVKYEEAILDLQLFLEERVEKSIKEIFPDNRPIILLDRGIMDIKAFMPDGYEREFERMLKKRSLDATRAKERYTGVLHLISCAEGMEEHYTTEGHPSRIESPDVARSLDRKIREAWLGHPQFFVIDNEDEFQKKISRTLAPICKMLGIPFFGGITKKYLVEKVNLRALPKHEKIEIEEYYVQRKKKEEEIKIKRRRQRGHDLYFVVRRYPLYSSAAQIEEERMVDENEYFRLFSMRDKSTIPLRMKRYCFLWQNQHFKLDVYLEPLKDLKILSVDLTEEKEKVNFPNFLQIGEDITFDPIYSEKNIAQKKPRLF